LPLFFAKFSRLIFARFGGDRVRDTAAAQTVDLLNMNHVA
jgi:hypothetical protein